MKQSAREQALSLACIWSAYPVTVLVDQGYRLLDIELYAVLLLFGLVGWGIGWVVRSKFVALLYGFSVYWFADTYFITGSGLALMVWLVSTAVLIALQKPLQPILQIVAPVFAVVFSLSIVLRPSVPVLTETGSSVNAKEGLQSALLYIIVDEQMSPFAPPGFSRSASFRKRFVSKFLEQGFTFWSHASSNYWETHKSIAAAMSMTNDTEIIRKNTTKSAFSYELKDNAFLSRLVSNGYDVSVLQSSYIDICGGVPGVRCSTYRRYGNMQAFSDEPIGQRLKLALLAFHDALNKQHGHGVVLYRNSVFMLANDTGTESFSGPVFSADLLRRMRSQVASIMPGQALVAHLLLPHFPYVLDAECALKPIETWSYPKWLGSGALVEKIYEDYWKQSECTQKLLMTVLDTVKDKDYLTIFIHGDHGARIARGTAYESNDDMLMTYFAVKRSNLSPKQIDDRRILQDLVINEMEYLLQR